MTTAEIEDRLAAVEREVAMLKSRASIPPINSDVPPKHPVHTLDQIHGIFEDDDAFREAMRLGREWRESARPKPRRRVGKRK